jgi:hypothetical protein
MSRIDEHLETLIKSVVSTLNARKIPCVLWGDCMLSIHGVSTFIGVSSFRLTSTNVHATDLS